MVNASIIQNHGDRSGRICRKNLFKKIPECSSIVRFVFVPDNFAFCIIKSCE